MYSINAFIKKNYCSEYDRYFYEFIIDEKNLNCNKIKFFGDIDEFIIRKKYDFLDFSRFYKEFCIVSIFYKNFT